MTETGTPECALRAHEMGACDEPRSAHFESPENLVERLDPDVYDDSVAEHDASEDR
jgi:hypothetical protein